MADVDLADYLAGLWKFQDPVLSVHPTNPAAHYTTIADAVSYLNTNSLDGKIFLMNGTHTCSGAIALPDQNIVVEGQSHGAVVQNNAGSYLFTAVDQSSTYSFRNFTISSQNVAAYSGMIYVYGTAAADNTASLICKDLVLNLQDAGTHNGNGDDGIIFYKGETGNAYIVDCVINGGRYGIIGQEVEQVHFARNTVKDTTIAGIVIPTVTTAYVSENYILDFLYNGIYVYSSSDYTNILGNILKGKDDATEDTPAIGISIAASNRAVVEGNQIAMENSRTEDVSNYIYGILLYEVGGSIVNGNRVRLLNDQGLVQKGIYLYDSDINLINSNLLAGVNNANDWGIHLANNSSNNLVVGNLSYNVGNGVNGVDDDEGVTNTLADNKDV